MRIGWIVFAAVLLILSLQSIANAQDHPFSFDLPTTLPSTQESASGLPIPDHPRTEGGLVEFLAARFSPLEPIYFIYGTDRPNIKFQFSLKYQLFSPEGSLYGRYRWFSGFYLGYSQTSFWDTQGQSSPFFDSSYRPELLYLYQQNDPKWIPGLTHFDAQAGIRHESNGRGGADSRSLNIIYAQPVLTFGDPGIQDTRGFFVAIAPRVWTYIFDLKENPDIKDYRGFADLRVVTGWRGGLQVSALGRMGDAWDHPSLEMDASYPLRNLLGKNLDFYLYGQFFTGYGESLLEYNKEGSSFRIGLAMVR
jgi:outer membrane phospholipase A